MGLFLKLRDGEAMSDPICKICGLPRSEHHEFEPVHIPDGCKCDPLDWRDGKILPVCEKFVYDPNYIGLCLTCEHPEECHK